MKPVPEVTPEMAADILGLSAPAATADT